MEGGSLNSTDQKGKAKAANVMSDDMQEPMPSLNKDAKIGDQEGNPEKESTVEGSSCDAGENTQPLNDQPSPVALVVSGGDDAAGSASVSFSNPSPRVAKDGETSGKKRSSFSCRYCEKVFPTAQGLGGHQSIHKYEREQAKKPRLEPLSPPLLYPKFDGSPFQYYYSNNFTALPRPPFWYPHAMFGFPASQYAQPTAGFTLGHPGQPMPVFNRPRMIMPNTLNNVNANYTSGNSNFGATLVGGQGSILEGFGAPNPYINSMGGGFNYMGIGGVRGNGCTNLDFPMPGSNGCFPSVGFEAAGTSRGVVRNLFGVSQGEGDGTIDLLSRVGMGTEENEEINGNGGNEEGES